MRHPIRDFCHYWMLQTTPRFWLRAWHAFGAIFTKSVWVNPEHWIWSRRDHGTITVKWLPRVGEYFTRYNTQGVPVAIIRCIGGHKNIMRYYTLGPWEVVWYFVRQRQFTLLCATVYETLAERAARRFPDWIGVW